MKYIIIVCLFILTGCIRINILEDGKTKVPRNNNVFKNKVKFTEKLLLTIDTAVVYEAYKNKMLCRLDNDPSSEFYGNFRFYSGGVFNYFVVNRNSIDKNDFNPAFNGYRGVYYSEGNKIRYELFGIASQSGGIGKLKGTLSFDGDTMYRIRDEDPRFTLVYVKRKLPPGFLNYKTTW